MTRNLDRLTYSRLATRRACPRRDYLTYELCLRRQKVDAPLRMGAAFARAKELWRSNQGLLDEADAQGLAYGHVASVYAQVPDWVSDTYLWEIEHETLRVLLAGYFWRYGQDNIEFLAAERTFEVPLVNPETGASSRTFTLAGKIDGIVRLEDSRFAVYEDKLTSENIDGEDYWQRLRYDGQISQYVVAARHLGYPVSTVYYDATRKPTIKPLAVPLTDEDGLKIVLDADGNRVLNKNGTPRQTGSTELGYVLQTRPETVVEWGERLLEDITRRPEYYYHRREIPRLEQDLTEFRAEVWQQSQLLRECRRNGWWFRNVAFHTCRNCSFKDLCLNGVAIEPGNPPAGYVIVDDPHPELASE